MPRCAACGPMRGTVDKVQIRALGGGSIARSFLVVGGRRRHVLAATGRELHGVARSCDRSARDACCRRRPTSRRPSSPSMSMRGCCLTDYQMMLWTPDLVRQPTVVAMIARLLRALHGLHVELPVYSVQGFASSYLTALASQHARARRARKSGPGQMSSRDSGVTSTRATRRRRSVTTTSALPTSSIDGAAAQAHRLRVCWARRAALDLASLAGMNDFAASQRRQLLDEYYGTAPAVPTHARSGQLRFAWSGC